MADWEGNGGGHENPNTVTQTNTENGPFNAQVWDYWGFIDPWGVPKLRIWQTTFSGGQPGLAIKVGDEWLFLKGKTAGGVLIFCNRLKGVYKYTELI